MNKYHHSKIYKIWSPSEDIQYIGSTTISLSQRLAKHKNHYKKYKNNEYHYVTSFDILEYDDYRVDLVEEFKCENIEQLRKKEGEYIRQQDCVNKYIAGRTPKQYKLDNIEEIHSQQKEYYLRNKEKIKKYREGRKEIIKKYNKKWYEENKDSQFRLACIM